METLKEENKNNRIVSAPEENLRTEIVIAMKDVLLYKHDVLRQINKYGTTNRVNIADLQSKILYLFDYLQHMILSHDLSQKGNHVFTLLFQTSTVPRDLNLRECLLCTDYLLLWLHKLHITDLINSSSSGVEIFK